MRRLIVVSYIASCYPRMDSCLCFEYNADIFTGLSKLPGDNPIDA
jgi:hypothetical protein